MRMSPFGDELPLRDLTRMSSFGRAHAVCVELPLMGYLSRYRCLRSSNSAAGAGDPMWAKLALSRLPHNPVGLVALVTGAAEGIGRVIRSLSATPAVPWTNLRKPGCTSPSELLWLRDRYRHSRCQSRWERFSDNRRTVSLYRRLRRRFR